MHLRQPGLRIKKFKETGYSQYIYQKELDKFLVNMTSLLEILKV